MSKICRAGFVTDCMGRSASRLRQLVRSYRWLDLEALEGRERDLTEHWTIQPATKKYLLKPQDVRYSANGTSNQNIDPCPNCEVTPTSPPMRRTRS